MEIRKFLKNRKGMSVGELYPFVLVIILVGMLVGVGILALDSFASSTGVTATAATAINATRAAISTIGTTWMSLIVTIGVLSIVIALVVRGFGGGDSMR